MLKNLSIIFILFIIIENTLYADSNLNDLIKLKDKSYSTSPNIQSIQNQKKESDAAKINAYTNHLPQVYLNIKQQDEIYNTNSAYLKRLGLSTPNSVWSLDYQWSLFNYKNILNTNLKSKTSEYNDLLNTIRMKSYEVDFFTDILNYVLARYKNAAIENSITKAETAKKEANLGFELGQKTKIDVLRADANVVSLNAKKITIEDEMQTTKSKFLILTGLEESELEALNNLNEKDYLNLIEDITATKQNSKLEFKKNGLSFDKLNLENQKINIESKALTNNLWPELKIQGSYENSSNTLKNTLSNPTRAHSIALVLTIPLFNSGASVAANFEEYFAKKKLEYLYSENKMTLESNLKNTTIKIKALETLVNSLILNNNQYEELFKLTTKSYQLGKSTLSELLEVQDNLLEAKINLASNKIQLYNLIENYKWQTGQQ